MGFFLGKDSGVRFTSDSRPGEIFTLFADSWKLNINGEKIDNTTIKILRDLNIENDLSSVPDWYNYGIPKIYEDGGMTDITLSVHGFLFFDDTVTLANGTRMPKRGEKGKVEILFKNTNGNKRPLYKMEYCFVVNADYNTDINKGIEFDIEFANRSGTVDTDPYPRGN